MDSTDDQMAVVMPACEANLLRKLAPGEPRFTLAARDISASLVVEFWALVNLYLRMRGRAGVRPDNALAEIETQIFQHFPATNEPIDEKLNAAFETATAMAKWPNRKVAD